MSIAKRSGDYLDCLLTRGGGLGRGQERGDCVTGNARNEATDRADQANQVCPSLGDRSGKTLRKPESLFHRDSVRTTQQDMCRLHLYDCVLIWDLLFSPKMVILQPARAGSPDL